MEYGAAGSEMRERGWHVALTRVQDGSRHRAVGRERSRPSQVQFQGKDNGFC